MKYILTLACLVSLTGCVHYKYPTNPDGSQIQVGSYMENSDIYMDSHFVWTKKGKLISEMNRQYELRHSTNRVK